ncbi:MAG TPA: type II secretion system protein GspD [Gammaproteobacteria bacterium]|nr:type II secretion system protein GspD [Gammaproteobacteria bacterium]
MKIAFKINILMLVWLLAGMPVQAETVTLNLKDADIGALISTVAEVTNRNFIVDPRVKGKVTVISSRPMDSEEVYQVFLSILKVHGFAAVPSGEVIKIVPDVNAKQDGIPTASDSAPGRGDQMVTRVVQVDNVAAAQLVPILRPLVPQQGHLAAYPTTNVLIISDRASNVERLLTIIRRIDQVSDSEIEVITLQHASATEVVRVLNSLSRTGPAAGKANAAVGRQVLVADERTNSVLLGGDRSSRLRMRAIISHLDTPLDAGGNTDVVYLRYAEATEIVDVLLGVGKIEEQEKTQQGKGTTARSTRGSFDIQADEATNALVITAPPDIMRTLKRVISKLDIRRAQVLVEAIIAEVGEDTARDLGVQWLFAGDTSNNRGPVGVINYSNSGSPIADIANAAISADSGGTVPALLDGALVGIGQFGSNSFNYAAVLNALASDTNTNILSTPTLVTLDNEEAEIVIGENVPFVTGSFTSTGAGDSASNPFQTIQREDVGLTLKIKPQINEGNAMRLEIEQEVSSIADSVAGAADIVTNKRSIKTNVMVDDGQVVVLGGLIEETINESVQKVPLLGDIPYLGALFRSKTSDVRKTNLMVFIHPVILRDAETMNNYTNAKYNDIRVIQMEQNNDGVNMMPGKQQPVLPNIHDYTIMPGPGTMPVPPEFNEVPVSSDDSASPVDEAETLFE